MISDISTSKYSVLDLGFNALLTREPPSTQDSVTPEMINSITQGLAAKNIQSGQLVGTLYNGKTKFDNTETGFILGIDSDDQNMAKFYIGNSSSYLNWTGTTLTIAGSITATSGTIGGFTIGATTISGVGTNTVKLNQSTFEVYTSGVLQARLSAGGLSFYDTDGITVLTNLSTGGGNLRTITIKTLSLSTTAGEGITGNVLPTADITSDIGASGRMFDDIWCDELHYNTLTAISDDKFKKDVIAMGDITDEFLQLQPKKYIRKATGVTEYGFIANEVREKFPEAVKEYTDTSGETHLGIDMMAMITASFQTIKKLSDEVEKLKKK